MALLHIRDLLQYEVLHKAMREHASLQVRGRHPDALFTINNIEVSYEQEQVTIDYTTVPLTQYHEQVPMPGSLIIPFPDFLTSPTPQKRRWVKQN